MKTPTPRIKCSMLFKAPAIVAIASIFLVGSGVPVSAQGSATPPLADLTAECLAGSAEYSYSQQTGLLDSAFALDGLALAKPPGITSFTAPDQAARGYLANCGPLFGLSDAAADLHLKRQTHAEQGHSVVKFQQAYRSIPVFAGELNVELNANQDVILVNAAILPEIALDTTPAVSATAARQAALQRVAEEYQLSSPGSSAGKAVSKPKLWIYDPALIGYEGATALVWRMEVIQPGPPPVRQLVLVDAQDGTIALSLNQLDTALTRNTYHMHNGTTYPGTLVCGTANPTCIGGDPHAKNAHIFAGDTYNFYKNNHGRDSLNNAGMTLLSHVHYASGYCNAFWNGSRMTYGDGCFLVTDDVVAHEMTHGVTDYESNLVYANQSGAINESFSDIWGEFVDLTNGKGTDTAAVRWLMGEDTSIGALRNMKNPPAMGDPDRMGSALFYYGTDDNGGVHINSGVGNKAAYLMTDGAIFNGYTVTPIGLTKTAKIFYKVQKDILTSGATYANLGNALSNACSLLVGTSGITAANCTQVRNATYATQMVPPPGTSFNTQFNGSAPKWQGHWGTWSIFSSAYYGSTGLGGGSWSSASYFAKFGNFDYSARVKRLDNGHHHGNYLIVRGRAYDYDSSNGWRNTYAFGYADDGNYSIWKFVNGVPTALQGWTITPYLNTGNAWNLLRVKAVGNTLSFYINGHLVKTVSATAFSTGRVGFQFYNGVAGGNQFLADYATLWVTALNASETTAGVVDPAQEALNQPANMKSDNSLTPAYSRP